MGTPAVTLAMLTLYLPAGATDAFFSALALVMLLVVRCGNQPIKEGKHKWK